MRQMSDMIKLVPDLLIFLTFHLFKASTISDWLLFLIMSSFSPIFKTIKYCSASDLSML